MTRLNGKWEGWTCDSRYLWGPDGERFKPDDMIKAQYHRAMYGALAGDSQTQIRFLKDKLEKRINEIELSTCSHSRFIDRLTKTLETILTEPKNAYQYQGKD